MLYSLSLSLECWNLGMLFFILVLAVFLSTSLSLSLSCMDTFLFWLQLGDYEIAWVDAEVGETENGTFSLLPLSTPTPPHKTVLVGDIKMADLKQYLASKGVQVFWFPLCFKQIFICCSPLFLVYHYFVCLSILWFGCILRKLQAWSLLIVGGRRESISELSSLWLHATSKPTQSV